MFSRAKIKIKCQQLFASQPEEGKEEKIHENDQNENVDSVGEDVMEMNEDTVEDAVAEILSSETKNLEKELSDENNNGYNDHQKTGVKNEDQIDSIENEENQNMEEIDKKSAKSTKSAKSIKSTKSVRSMKSQISMKSGRSIADQTDKDNDDEEDEYYDNPESESFIQNDDDYDDLKSGHEPDILNVEDEKVN